MKVVQAILVVLLVSSANAFKGWSPTIAFKPPAGAVFTREFYNCLLSETRGRGKLSSPAGEHCIKKHPFEHPSEEVSAVPLATEDIVPVSSNSAPEMSVASIENAPIQDDAISLVATVSSAVSPVANINASSVESSTAVSLVAAKTSSVESPSAVLYVAIDASSIVRGPSAVRSLVATNAASIVGRPSAVRPLVAINASSIVERSSDVRPSVAAAANASSNVESPSAVSLIATNATSIVESPSAVRPLVAINASIVASSSAVRPLVATNATSIVGRPSAVRPLVAINTSSNVESPSAVSLIATISSSFIESHKLEANTEIAPNISSLVIVSAERGDDTATEMFASSIKRDEHQSGNKIVSDSSLLGGAIVPSANAGDDIATEIIRRSKVMSSKTIKQFLLPLLSTLMRQLVHSQAPEAMIPSPSIEHLFHPQSLVIVLLRKYSSCRSKVISFNAAIKQVLLHFPFVKNPLLLFVLEVIFIEPFVRLKSINTSPILARSIHVKAATGVKMLFPPLTSRSPVDSLVLASFLRLLPIYHLQ